MTDKTDLIDEFQTILEEDLLFWNFEKELCMGDHKLRIFSKSTDNKGNTLAPSEINFRIQCFLKDITADVAFECMSNSVERSKWDPRMSDIK